MVHNYCSISLSHLRWDGERHSFSTPVSLVYGYAMLEHVLRTQVVCHQDGSQMTSISPFTFVGSGGAGNARRSSRLGHITARLARGIYDGFSTHLPELCVDASFIDAYQRWITIVPGRSTAFHIVPFLISSASSSTLSFQ